jgi:hypothetical protein
MLAQRSPRASRATGALIGAAFGVLLLGLTAANAAWDRGPTQYSYGCVVLLLGGSLGWSYGPRAARTGLWNAVDAAVRITAIGVPLGAVLVALFWMPLEFLSADPSAYMVDSGIGGAIAGVLGMALLGLVFLGLPMMGLTFVAASIWVFLVRFALAWLGVGRPRPASEPAPVGPPDDIARGRVH